MIKFNALVVLVVFLFHEAASADLAQSEQSTRDPKIERLQKASATDNNVEEDSLADLFISEGEAEEATVARSKSNSKANPPPTFESWDVLRQYPRYDVIAEPQKAKPNDKVTTNNSTQKTQEKESDESK